VYCWDVTQLIFKGFGIRNYKTETNHSQGPGAGRIPGTGIQIHTNYLLNFGIKKKKIRKSKLVEFGKRTSCIGPMLSEQ